MSLRTKPEDAIRICTLGKVIVLMAALMGVRTMQAESLPDAPSTVLGLAPASISATGRQQPTTIPSTIAAPAVEPQAVVVPPPCDQIDQQQLRGIPWLLRSPREDARCHRENPLQQILSTKNVPPLTPELKGFLAIRNTFDPFNLGTTVAYSGIQIAVNSHTAYGPGYAGWGRLTGYSLLEDAQFEFFDTFAVPSLVHEDPRYHRMPNASIKRRLGHALIHTVWTQHDDGTPMINYATLASYPISAALDNLYVPGISTSASATGKRILAGYATDPVGPLIAEFLPDVAKHIHVRTVFVQQIIQKIATNSSNGQ